jgi:hypothetical protein
MKGSLPLKKPSVWGEIKRKGYFGKIEGSRGGIVHGFN